jgi:hypothetical protein
MRVLVATAETQGEQGGDFHHAVEGELVRIDPPCASDRCDPDGRCGCGRSFAGLNSARATTTARVADVPLSRDDVVEALGSSLAQQGWCPGRRGGRGRRAARRRRRRPGRHGLRAAALEAGRPSRADGDLHELTGARGYPGRRRSAHEGEDV